jgi:pyridoxal phosphate enzyme (YggS family)
MIAENISGLKQEIGQNVQLIVVSKYRTIEEIKEAYQAGQRLFAENRVQALLERKEALPGDIVWHLIGHLQSNKVKYIAPFINCIQSIDSVELLDLVNQQAAKNGRTIDCLLQVHIAVEETKFGLSETECAALIEHAKTKGLSNIRIKGLMGMASNTDDQEQVKTEFLNLQTFYNKLKDENNFDTLSMGMSGDYQLAIACGSNMVRVGSKVFS